MQNQIKIEDMPSFKAFMNSFTLKQTFTKSFVPFHFRKGQQPPNTKAPGPQTSPSGGEKLLRLLSISEQRKEDGPPRPPQGGPQGGDSVAAFFAQVSQASNVGPPGLPPVNQPPPKMMNPLQSLLGDPAVMSGVPMGAPGVHPPPMPTMAKSASDLESDMKPNKKTPQKKTPNSKKPVTRQEASNGATSKYFWSIHLPLWSNKRYG